MQVWYILVVFLHILHLIITNCIFCQPGVEALIKKCKNIVTLNKRSITEKHIFESIELEEEKNTSGYRLHQMVAIRWNSIFYMLKQFHRIKDRLVLYLHKSEKCEELTKPEWAKLDLVVKVLEPFENVSKMYQ